MSLASTASEDLSRQAGVLNLEWRGITVQVTYVPDWLGIAGDGVRVAHLEVLTLAPEGAPLPITETGYRSHFLDPAAVAEAGGAVAFVTAWLDHDAKGKAWKTLDAASRQISLF